MRIDEKRGSGRGPSDDTGEGQVPANGKDLLNSVDPGIHAHPEVGVARVA